MAEVDLLRALPKTKRNIQKRKDAKDPAVVAISKQYGEMYFDGPRDYGYGGYRYDGRWVPVARDIVAHFGLKPGMRDIHFESRICKILDSNSFFSKDIEDVNGRFSLCFFRLPFFQVPFLNIG